MTTCPFCNADLPAESTRQAACPRCGEIVPTAATTAVVQRDEPPAVEERLPNRRIALIVVTVMFAMATIGLIFALNTTEQRRANDTRGQEKAGPDVAAAPTKPTELAGLGFVPADTHALLGIHVAQLRAHPAGEALLRRLRAADDLSLARLTDHLLVGINGKSLPPRVTFVAHSPTELDSSRLEAGYPGGRPAKNGDRILAKHTDGRWGFDIWLGRADSKTLVACQLPADFDAVPTTPQPGTEQFTHLHQLLTKRLDPRASAWMVGTFPKENAVLFTLMTLLPLPAADRLALQSLQGVALSLRAEGDDLLLTLDVQGRDRDATASLAEWAERSLRNAGVTAARKTDGDWQRLTAKLNGEAIAKWSAK